MLTRKVRYGVRALTVLASRQTETIPLRELAEQFHIPRKYLEVIMVELRNAGLVHSTRGKGGGYQLSKTATQITLAEIVQVLDPELLSRGVDGAEHHIAPEGPVWQEMESHLRGYLDDTTLSRIALLWSSRHEPLVYSI